MRPEPASPVGPQIAGAADKPSHRRWFPFYWGWWIVAAGFLSQVVIAGSTGWIFTLLIKPMEGELGWSRSELVGVLTVINLINGGLSATLGPIVDRYGPRWFMTVSALMGGVCLMLVGVVTEPWQYYLLLGVGFGVADAGLQNLGPVTAIANWFIRKRAKAFTVSTVGSPLTGLLLVPAVAWLIDFAGWRSGWLVLGLISWLITPLAWFAVRRRPEDVGLLPDGDRTGALAEEELDMTAASAGKVDEPSWSVREVLRDRSFWLLVFSFSLFQIPAAAIFVHMAPFIVEKGFSATFAAFVISLYGLTVFVGRFIWGYAIGRLGIRRPLISYGFIYGASIAFFIVPASEIGISVATALLGLAVGGWLLFQSQTFPDYFGRKIVGSLLGYAGIFFMAARAVAPLFAALVYDSSHSYVIPFSVFALACFVGSAALLLAPPPIHKGKQALAV